MEIIDSSKMQVLADFRYVDEPINNIEHYYLGILGNNFVTRIRDLAGNYIGKVFFERDNYAEVVKKMEDVYAGKLRELSLDNLNFQKGNDSLIIEITETFPHTSFKPIINFSITNNREAILDERKRDGWFLYMSQETGRKMLEEMKRIKDQVIN